MLVPVLVSILVGFIKRLNKIIFESKANQPHVKFYPFYINASLAAQTAYRVSTLKSKFRKYDVRVAFDKGRKLKNIGFKPNQN